MSGEQLASLYALQGTVAHTVLEAHMKKSPNLRLKHDAVAVMNNDSTSRRSSRGASQNNILRSLRSKGPPDDDNQPIALPSDYSGSPESVRSLNRSHSSSTVRSFHSEYASECDASGSPVVKGFGKDCQNVPPIAFSML